MFNLLPAPEGDDSHNWRCMKIPNSDAHSNIHERRRLVTGIEPEVAVPIRR
jgi:hypothetical protein